MACAVCLEVLRAQGWAKIETENGVRFVCHGCVVRIVVHVVDMVLRGPA